MIKEMKKSAFPLVCWITLAVVYYLSVPASLFILSFNRTFTVRNDKIWYSIGIILILISSVAALVLFINTFKRSVRGDKVPLKIKIPLLIITLPVVFIVLWVVVGELIVEPIYQAIKMKK